MLMKKTGGILGLVVAGILLSGCGSTMAVTGNGGSASKSVSTESLKAMRWTLSTVQHGKSAPMAKLKAGIPANRYKLTFSDDGVSLQGGCNVASSSFQLNTPDKMTTGEWRSTMMACETPLMRADSEMTDLLGNVANYRLNGQQLILSGGGNALVFNGIVTDESRYGGGGVRKFIEIRNAGQGLSWREVTYDSNWVQNNKNAPWIQGNFPGIRDFKPEMNMTYIVRINEYRDQATGKVVWVKDMVTMQGIL